MATVAACFRSGMMANGELFATTYNPRLLSPKSPAFRPGAMGLVLLSKTGPTLAPTLEWACPYG